MPRNPYTCVDKCFHISQHLLDALRVNNSVTALIVRVGGIGTGAAFTDTGGLAPLGVSLLASAFACTATVLTQEQKRLWKKET